MRQCILFLFFVCAVRAQVNVEVKIVGAGDNTTLQQNNLNQELQSQNLSTAVVISSNAQSEIFIQQCGTGTYAESSSTVCTACAAGTASPTIGATSHLTCQICSPGAYAPQQASTCTLCPTTTFSPTAAAPDSSTCLACPPNSNSLAGTDSITKCTCNDRYFIPTNTLQVLDPPAPFQFESWAALPVNTMLINVPHVACA